MFGFLLTIAFIINIFTLIAVFLLFKRVQLLKDENTNKFREMTEVFLKEVRKENEQLQRSLLKNSAREEHFTQKSDYPHVTAQKNNQDVEIKKQSSYLDDAKVDKVNDQFETSLQAQILNLHNQGKSTEEIAQQLNCGTTEAELIIKLHK